METENETPQKIRNHKFIFNCQITTPDSGNIVTPKNTKCLRKSINPRTPKAAQSLSCYSLTTCNTMMSNSGSSHSISMAVIQTPPAKRYQRVRNPFEAALAERLHMPLIASPSLFQRPDTPQMSSTQCEWTIDEVSSMMPANVEPHETQFHDSPDPELEAKAQSAISSYFKEHQVVPSPVDCPLRSQRIVLEDITGNTPISKPGRRIRDCASQTELTLPPKLPPALEEALKPYFQPHLAGTSTELKKSRYAPRSSTSSCSSVDPKDTSLRRKLFDIHNVLIWENETQHIMQGSSSAGSSSRQNVNSNSSPISLQSLQHTAIIGKLSDSLDKSSFGSLSPISASDDISPSLGQGSASKRKSRFDNLRNEIEELEQLSPIHPPARRKPSKKVNCHSQDKENTCNDSLGNTSQDTENEKFTPERSSSPLTSMSTNNIAEFSSDSFNIKISRLKVNTSKCSSSKERLLKPHKTNQSLQDVDVFMCQDETIEDMLECTGDIEEMQMSQHSTHSSNCSSSQSDTPRSKKRSASRKNLSQSFSANWLNDEDGDEEDDKQRDNKLAFRSKINAIGKQDFHTANTNPTSSSFGGVVRHTSPAVNNSPKKSLTFYRTDSGFNEMSQNSSGSQDCANALQQQPLFPPAANQLLVCCSSTPSTKDKFDFIM